MGHGEILAFIGMDLYYLSLLLFNLLMRMYSLKPRLYMFGLLLYLVYNGRYFDDVVECKEDNCFYSRCWLECFYVFFSYCDQNA